MIYRGKPIDIIKLWSDYVEFPPNADLTRGFAPLVYCPSPFHLNSHTPAFQINLDKPYVHCFGGCGISGTYDHAIAIIEGIYEKDGVSSKDLLDARTRPRPKEPVELRQSRTKVSKARKKAAVLIFRRASIRGFSVRAGKPSIRAVHRSVPSLPTPSVELEEKLGDYSYLPKEALAYLKSRGIEAHSRSRWQIGFNEETKRITIPVRDSRDRLKFIIERAIYGSQRPAYLYPEGSLKSSLLFGTCALDRSLIGSQGLILVEGALDCILMHQDGFRNTAALLGNSLSNKQLREITRLNPRCIYLFLDHDEAGVLGVERATQMLEKKYPLRVPLYPKSNTNLDPATLTKQQKQKAIAKAVPALYVKKKLKAART